jgi:phospholipid/cholesterol/gamma-HCH transport system substrate-binding protein
VTYRGVEAGRVTRVVLDTSDVTLTLAIEHGTRIPDNAIAHVYDLSAVGEQYVDLVPTGDSTSYLHAGSVIPADRTTTPLQTATVLYDLERFVSSINPHDVQIIGTEGAAAFANTGPQLRSLLADSTSIVSQLSSTQGAALDLVKNAATLLHGAASHANDFDIFAASLNALSATLASSTPTIQQFLDEAAPATALVDALITTNGSPLTVLLGNLAALSDIQVARLPGLRSLLVAVPQFGRLAPSLVSNGALNGAVNFTMTQALCQSGVPMSNPLSGTRTPLKNAGCDKSVLVRGANNAPRPGATATASFDQAILLPTAVASTSGQAQVGGYDLSTGLVPTADGSTVRLGTDGGQNQVLGDNSWQALLLAVTGG